jgi:hypothetical protein
MQRRDERVEWNDKGTTCTPTQRRRDEGGFETKGSSRYISGPSMPVTTVRVREKGDDTLEF